MNSATTTPEAVGMGRIAGLLAAIGALGVAFPAAAQPETSQPASTQAAPADDASNTIVVNGKKQPPSGDQVIDQARALSRVAHNRLYQESLPRFETPLCPGVLGLKAEAAGVMVKRIRVNAARLRVRLAQQECSPNLVIAFVDDPHALLADLERRHPNIFGLVATPERTELLDDGGPVRVWSNIATRWTGAGSPPEPGLKPSVWGQMNRASLPERHDIVSSLVLFDRHTVEGMTLVQLADYATMRGLADTRPPQGDEPMATILALFAGGSERPAELTSFDVGYLRGLYFWKGNEPAISKFVRIRRQSADAAKEPREP